MTKNYYFKRIFFKAVFAKISITGCFDWTIHRKFNGSENAITFNHLPFASCFYIFTAFGGENSLIRINSFKTFSLCFRICAMSLRSQFNCSFSCRQC